MEVNAESESELEPNFTPSFPKTEDRGLVESLEKLIPFKAYYIALYVKDQVAWYSDTKHRPVPSHDQLCWKTLKGRGENIWEAHPNCEKWQTAKFENPILVAEPTDSDDDDSVGPSFTHFACRFHKHIPEDGVFHPCHVLVFADQCQKWQTFPGPIGMLCNIVQQLLRHWLESREKDRDVRDLCYKPEHESQSKSNKWEDKVEGLIGFIKSISRLFLKRHPKSSS